MFMPRATKNISKLPKWNEKSRCQGVATP